jgi:DNA-binding MarR family transcriptional regulator
MADQLSLPSLLSHALVAFTIELDNEFEHQMPHRTRDYGSTGRGGPWLVSMVMWFNCMQFVGEEPMPVAELERQARTPTNLDGMRRWGYVFLEPADPADRRPKPPRSELTIRATPQGIWAQEVWRPLPGLIEDRWRDRFGATEIGRLRASLWDLARQIEAELPDCLPILRYGLFSKRGDRYTPRAPQTGPDPGLPLPVLLAQVLLGFAIRFEQHSPLSLALCANVLRVLDSGGVRVRDLPALGGVSKESVSMAMGVLEKADLVTVGPDPGGGRWKVARLTAAGQEAKWEYADRIAALEERSAHRFGAAPVPRLRADLERLVGDPGDAAGGSGVAGGGGTPLMRGLEPYPDNWRASVRPPRTLPHFPMVLHRGGYPDGS